jgi:NADH-ubiquinone oxidoreductase chain 6
MSSMLLYTENVTNGSNHIYLNILSIAAVISGLLVIISKNPIVSVLFLIGLFLSISGYLMMLGLNFIGLSYLLVYVGAVSILFLFILMLINVRISELVTDTSNSLPLAILIGIVFNSIIYIDNIVSLSYNFSKSIIYIKEISFNNNHIFNLNSDASYLNNSLSVFKNEIFNDLNYVTSNI